MNEDGNKIYSLDDVARELGVSKTTVSRAISGKGRISQATRDRVQSFVESHDFRPNVAARGLAQKKTFNLALLLPIDYAAADFQFFKDCMNGICEAAARHDYDIVISMVGGDDLTQLQRLVRYRKVDGMILSRAVEYSRTQLYLKEKQMPYLVIGPNKDPDTMSVDNQNEEASRELTELMLFKGMRRLALLGGQESYSVTQSRYRGFEQAHEKAGIQMHPELFSMNVDNYQHAMKAVEKALSEGADGIICMDDYICELALGCLRERGVAIPQQIRIASLYDSLQIERNNPPVSSVRFDTKKLGQNACLKLLKLLGEEIEEAEHISNYQVILRESTK
jgi:DNA-binding LacI/PurR family transcriptional regulator